MTARKDRQTRGSETNRHFRTLRGVLQATGGAAKIEELYRVMRAEEAARFLGLAEPTVRDMTYRHELPCVKLGARAVGYRVIDLIDWQKTRRAPARG
ncbi:helix-turn-helix domain-containing protein [Candidatus Binatus sp.]|uniref:helix-turn-helix transcriptional regulator n=1 Tax=Candidatus Binatus sp. TaxID=2811406 RepID=UPI002F92DBF5